MAGKKKTPLRKCVVTNDMKPKKELIRIVRTPEGNVLIDPTSKKAGRGAYISLDKEVILDAKKKDILSKHLKVAVPLEIYEELVAETTKGKFK
ncbi:YlxR family protein [Evansella sp. AB-P1]|uniref:RNase P modulator RnpM n=1 Tax=Evansella sp. AB-P1 TaxID=3037653 RepID=UPI00241F7EEC|nr:YlxR family protein [Evansella sp. AB-P1]MDG5788990.1 YlxR family protein [Evansella sp. AB-P1]